MPRKLKVPIVFALLSILSGCATTAGIVDTSCSVFRPITYSKKDTEITKNQIDKHNRIYEHNCKSHDR